MEFLSPLSDGRRWMPALLAIVVLPLVAVFPLVLAGPRSSLLLVLTVGASPVLLVLWAWRIVARPLVYVVKDGGLDVPAHLGRVRMALADAEVWTGPFTGWKVSGTNLADFGLGLFADRDGTCHVAATSEQGVWVKAAGKRTFVTPTDTAGFVEAVVAAGARRRD